jgi:hypothetical protein
MSEYDESDVSETESNSEGENPDYASEQEEPDEFKTERRNKKIYNELIKDKLGTILDFNNGKINEREYSIFIAGINKQLRELEFEDTTLNRKLLELELELKILLETFERKINFLKEKKNRDFLNIDEIKELIALEFTIDTINEESSDKSYLIDYRDFINKWDIIPTEEQDLITKSVTKAINKKKKNPFPIDFPVKTDFLTEPEYRSALKYFFNRFGEQFFEMFGVFFPGFFEEFENQEIKEIDNTLKKLNIFKPRKGSQNYEDRLLEYYRQGVQYLPGYVLKMKTGKIGESFEKVLKMKKLTKKHGYLVNVSEKSPIQLFEEMKQLRQDLPVQLSPSEQLYQRKLMVVQKILKKFTKEQLIECVMGATRFKESVSVLMRPNTAEELENLTESRVLGEFKPNKITLKPKKVDLEVINKVPDYDILTLKQIEQMLLNENMNLDSLNYTRNRMEKENQNGIYIIDWKPEKILSPEELIKWNKFKTEILNSTKKDFIKILLLNGYRAKLLEKFGLNVDYSKINKEISNTVKNIKDLETVKNYKAVEEMNKYRKGYQTTLKQKFKVPPEKPNPISNLKPYLFINNLNEVAQAYKRKLIIDSLKLKQPYKILDLLELYDINELNNKMIIDDIKVLNLDTYTKIKGYLVNELNKSFRFEQINNKMLFESIKILSEVMGIPIDLTTPKKAIEELIKNWKPTFNGEILFDYYGENLILKLTTTDDPFKFYTNIREYDNLVRNFTPPEEKVYTRPTAVFQGELYTVYYLDKDWGTKQPLKQYKSELQKNQRTGQYEVVNKIVEKRGKYPFILRQLKTTSEGKTKDVWVEISPSLVTYSSSK